jgi:hypothetical protein
MMGNYHVRFGEGFREKQVMLLALSLLYSSGARTRTAVALSTTWSRPRVTIWG